MQAVEALLSPPLEGAVECLLQAQALAEQQRKTAAAGGQGAASFERLQEVVEAAEAALEMISSDKISTLTQVRPFGTAQWVRPALLPFDCSIVTCT